VPQGYYRLPTFSLSPNLLQSSELPAAVAGRIVARPSWPAAQLAVQLNGQRAAKARLRACATASSSLAGLRESSVVEIPLVLIRGKFFVFVDYARVMDTPANPVSDRPRVLDVERQPPQMRVSAENLLEISPGADIELGLLPVFALEVLDGGVVLPHQLNVELHKVRQCTDQESRDQEPETDDEVVPM